MVIQQVRVIRTPGRTPWHHLWGTDFSRPPGAMLNLEEVGGGRKDALAVVVAPRRLGAPMHTGVGAAGPGGEVLRVGESTPHPSGSASKKVALVGGLQVTCGTWS